MKLASHYITKQFFFTDEELENGQHRDIEQQMEEQGFEFVEDKLIYANDSTYDYQSGIVDTYKKEIE